MEKFQRIHTFIPDRPGNYWVVRIIINSQGASQICDDGFARWDGQRWDRQDWDYWYGTAKVLQGDVK